MRKGIKRDYLLLDYPPNSFDYVLDIGGCSGYFTDGVLEVSPNAQVVVYEPSKDAFEFISKKFAQNSNVTLVNKAIGTGEKLYAHPDLTWSSAFFSKFKLGGEGIESYLLSDIIQEHGFDFTKPCALKLDCEGGEWSLLEDPNVIPLMKQFVYIAIEIHFPPRAKNKNTQFNMLPPWKKFDKWIRSNFSDEFEILYHHSDSAHGHGVFVLTRPGLIPRLMKFKNCMVANKTDSKRYSFDKIELLVKAQIENSIEIGWDPEDIWLISNFDYEYMGVKSINTSLNKKCLTGSKMFGMKFLFDNGMMKDTVVWSHDLDAWQNVPFNAPHFKDVGIVCYSNTKYNGGSIFWREASRDIVDEVVRRILENQQNKEEPTLNAVLKSTDYAHRVTVLNNTYNVGCSGYVVRYDKSIKPIRVCHFHPYNRMAWETHALDRNGLDTKGITDRLEKTIRKYYKKLPQELPEESKKVQAERRERRKKGLPVKPKRKKKG